MDPVSAGGELPELLDSARLAGILDALASPVRIDLLKALRVPRSLAEIQLQPRRGAAGRPRAMSRVAVRRHLERLLEIGIVRSQPAVRGGRQTTLYLVSHGQAFALAEELRRLALLRADQEGTQLGPSQSRPRTGQASLTVVNGLREGWQATLEPGGTSWLVGRHASCAVRLDYDPYVSLRHAEVQHRGGRHWLVDRPESRNGTTLNWDRAPKGEPQPLRTGDVVGVGRSLLVFRSG